VGSIIIELQKNALDENYPISSLLRKAYLVASKLNISELQVWANNELNGYTSEEHLPKYRKTKGEIKAHNPFQGWIKVLLPDDEWEEMVTLTSTGQSVAEIEQLAKSSSSSLIKNFNVQHLTSLQEIFNTDFDMKLFIPLTSMHHILSAVRNTILDWSLKLGSKGIQGEGLEFTNNEKEKAVTSNTINIENFQGVLGDVSGSTLSQELNQHINKNDFDQLANVLREKEVLESDIAELSKCIEIDGQITDKKFGESVSSWIGSMISKAADGSWNISIATAGNLLGAVISKYYGMA